MMKINLSLNSASASHMNMSYYRPYAVAKTDIATFILFKKNTQKMVVALVVLRMTILEDDLFSYMYLIA